MKAKDRRVSVKLIPVDHITVFNPRVRNQSVFREIVNSKKIVLTRTPDGCGHHH